MAKEKKEKNEKIEKISKSVDILLHNRLIVAIFVMVDGINFIINPKGSLEFMSMMIAFFALLAAGGIIVTNITTKKMDWKSIIPSIIVMLLCIYVIISPKILAQNLRFLVSLFIICNGLINIFNIIKLDKVSASLNYAENSIKGHFTSEEENKTFDKKMILDQTEKVANPIGKAISHTSGHTIIFFILNIISIFLGVVYMLNDSITIIICGVILIYTGLFDALMYLKSLQLSKKLKQS